jgi:hypothetical protein
MLTGLDGQRMFKWPKRNGAWAILNAAWAIFLSVSELGRFQLPTRHEPTSALQPPLFSTPAWLPPSPSLPGARHHPGRSRRSTGPPPREAHPPRSFPPRPVVALTVELSAGALPPPRQSTPVPCPRPDLRQGLSRKTPGREVRAPRGAPPASRELARPVVCRQEAGARSCCEVMLLFMLLHCFLKFTSQKVSKVLFNLAKIVLQ